MNINKMKLKNNDKLLDAIFDVANIGICLTDEEGKFVTVNDTYCNIYGYNRDELIGNNFTMILPRCKREEAMALHNKFINGGTEINKQWKVIRKDGRILNIYATAGLLENDDGEKFKVTTVTDVTEINKTKEKLNLVNRILSSASEGIFFTNSKPSEIIYGNRAYSRISGLETKEMINDTNKLFGLIIDQEKSDMIWRELERNGFWEGEIEGKNRKYKKYSANFMVFTIKNKNGEITNYVGILNEITEKKKIERQMKQMAEYSILTNLHNRHAFTKILDRELTRCRNEGNKIALIMIGLDRFKNINDAFGYKVGDKILKLVSNRLKEYIKKNCNISHFGGDKFAIILSNIPIPEYASTVANDIKELIEKSFHITGKEIYITSSIGISIFPDESKYGDELIKHSEKALAEAKRKGRNRIYYYTQALNDKITRRLEIEYELRNCIKKEELYLMYQPQIDLKEEKIVGVEALLRWKNSKYGLVSPAEFIPIAEETGIIKEIGRWVLEEAAKQINIWNNKGLPRFNVAVNLSSYQLRQENIVSIVKQVIDENNIEHNQLELELTESLMMHNVDRSIKVLNEFKNMGIQISIDDFGTGYSSLSYIRKIPISKLKIDRSFIMGFNGDFESSIITKTIIDMAHNLKFKVIAEGVETKEQLKFLKVNNCDEVQGYYYSKPLLSHDLENFIYER